MLFRSTLNGKYSQHVMDEQTFRDFIDYSVLVARQGCKELKEGYIAPTPYDNTCEYCKFGGLCGFNKEKALPRVEASIDSKTIASVAKSTRDGEEA